MLCCGCVDGGVRVHDAGGGAAKNSDGFLVGCVDSFLEEGDGPAGDEGGDGREVGAQLVGAKGGDEGLEFGDVVRRVGEGGVGVVGVRSGGDDGEGTGAATFCMVGGLEGSTL